MGPLGAGARLSPLRPAGSTPHRAGDHTGAPVDRKAASRRPPRRSRRRRAMQVLVGYVGVAADGREVGVATVRRDEARTARLLATVACSDPPGAIAHTRATLAHFMRGEEKLPDTSFPDPDELVKLLVQCDGMDDPNAAALGVARSPYRTRVPLADGSSAGSGRRSSATSTAEYSSWKRSRLLLRRPLSATARSTRAGRWRARPATRDLAGVSSRRTQTQ
jgi:hypothetical protein